MNPQKQKEEVSINQEHDTPEKQIDKMRQRKKYYDQ